MTREGGASSHGAVTIRHLDGSLMLARQRQAFILDRVREDGAVRVADLVRELGVSDMTVRRDLEILDERGLLEKVHGGATSIAGTALFEPGFALKSALQQSEKDAIADAAVALVEPGMAIAVSAGTTTYALAQRLALVPGLTVVTNSVRVADVLHQNGRTDQTIILTGGVRTPSDALAGPFAVAALRSVHVDLVFVGVHGMDQRSGFTCPNLLEADTDRALIEAGRRLVVVADHSKWGVIGISSIARLDQADVLITDVGLSPEARRILVESVRELVVVDPGVPVADQLREIAESGQPAIIPGVVAAGLIDAVHAD
jgi:DeoR/GlpR family transcriptional regulator of sugar metabolism